MFAPWSLGRMTGARQACWAELTIRMVREHTPAQPLRVYIDCSCFAFVQHAPAGHPSPAGVRSGPLHSEPIVCPWWKVWCSASRQSVSISGLLPSLSRESFAPKPLSFRSVVAHLQRLSFAGVAPSTVVEPRRPGRRCSRVPRSGRFNH